MNKKQQKQAEWSKFNRFHGSENFYGCVDPEGNWFDSATFFETAVHWCCMSAGVSNLSPAEELRWMSECGFHIGYSVIHSSMLRKMYEAGLLK